MPTCVIRIGGRVEESLSERILQFGHLVGRLEQDHQIRSFPFKAKGIAQRVVVDATFGAYVVVGVAVRVSVNIAVGVAAAAVGIAVNGTVAHVVVVGCGVAVIAVVIGAAIANIVVVAAAVSVVAVANETTIVDIVTTKAIIDVIGGTVTVIDVIATDESNVAVAAVVINIVCSQKLFTICESLLDARLEGFVGCGRCNSSACCCGRPSGCCSSCCLRCCCGRWLWRGNG